VVASLDAADLKMLVALLLGVWAVAFEMVSSLLWMDLMLVMYRLLFRKAVLHEVKVT
jgi:hypothetical protein